MKIAVFSIEAGDDVRVVIDKIFDLSVNKNVSYQIYSELYESLNLNDHSLFNNHSDLDPKIDLMISIGGDGTFTGGLIFNEEFNKLINLYFIFILMVFT